MTLPRLLHGRFLPDFQFIISTVILPSILYDLRFAWGHKMDLKINNSDGSVKGIPRLSGTCWQQLCPYSLFNVGLDVY